MWHGFKYRTEFDPLEAFVKANPHRSNDFIDSVLVVALVLTIPVAFLIWLDGEWNELGFLLQVYIVGVVSYWLVCILNVLANCIRLASIFDQNMDQIGLRRNVFCGVFQEKQSIDYVWSFMAAVFVVLFVSLLSWFAYLVDLYLYIKTLIYRWRRPKAIKEIEWILKNHLLSPLDVLRFDVKTREIVLGRELTWEECEVRQQQLNENGVEVKMEEVIAINRGEILLRNPV